MEKSSSGMAPARRLLMLVETLLPGFDDAHVHFVSGGSQLDAVSLNDANSPQEFASRIAAQVAEDS